MDSSRPANAPSQLTKCKNCEKEFEPKKPWQKFCKAKCRDTWHNVQKILKSTFTSNESEKGDPKQSK